MIQPPHIPTHNLPPMAVLTTAPLHSRVIVSSRTKHQCYAKQRRWVVTLMLNSTSSIPSDNQHHANARYIVISSYDAQALIVLVHCDSNGGAATVSSRAMDTSWQPWWLSWSLFCHNPPCCFCVVVLASMIWTKKDHRIGTTILYLFCLQNRYIGHLVIFWASLHRNLVCSDSVTDSFLLVGAVLCICTFIVEFSGQLVSWNGQSQCCGHQF